MTHTNEDLLALADRLDKIEIYSVREHLSGLGTRPIEAANNAVCEAAAALHAIVAEQQAIRDKALEDAALECDRLSSEQRMYLFSDPGMFGGQWIRVAGLCATAIRAMKGTTE